MIKTQKKEKGFTLIETLVALAVLSTALVGTLTLIITNVTNAKSIERSLVAGNLAQEALEIVRNIRDNDWFEINGFGSFLPGNGEYRVQWNDTMLRPIGDNPTLLLDGSSGMYGYDTGQATLFRRKVLIEKISDVEIRVLVTVEWEARGRISTLEAESHLFNWF